jgi:hypothetical protein
MDAALCLAGSEAEDGTDDDDDDDDDGAASPREAAELLMSRKATDCTHCLSKANSALRKAEGVCLRRALAVCIQPLMNVSQLNPCCSVYSGIF